MQISFIRRVFRWFLFFCFSLGLLNAQEESGSGPDLRQLWTELEARDDLMASDRLSQQADLLQVAGLSAGWGDAVLWDLTIRTLDKLEVSPDVKEARATYLSLLEAIGEGLGSATEPIPGEARLSGYYRKALGVTAGSVEEGQLLLYLAESLLRVDAGLPEVIRRADAYLEQAEASLPESPPKDAVHYRLAGLKVLQSGSGAVPGPGVESFLSQAVFHYGKVLEMETSREHLRREARKELDILLQPGLSLELGHRFLPMSEVRLRLTTRNLREVEVEVYTLPWLTWEVPLSWNKMLETPWRDSLPLESVWTRKTFPLTSGDRFDWGQTELRLGDDFPPGWYWIRVSAESLEVASPLLVTPLELAAIPRSTGAMAVWVVDTESGVPVANAPVHLLDDKGNLLARGMSDATGLAEIDAESARDWREIFVSDGINPSLIIRDGLDTISPRDPLLIPVTMECRPGMDVEWILLGEGLLVDPFEAGFKVLLPNGELLDPEVVESGTTYLHCKVSLPAGLRSYGPLYLEYFNGTRVLLSHLGQDQALPYRLEFSGERIGRGGEVYLSTAPVTVGIFPDFGRLEDPEEFIRIRVTEMSRKVVHDASESPFSGTPEVLLERILRIDGEDALGTYFELPELPVGGEMLPLKVEVLPLDLEEVLGVAGLALVPARSTVALRTSERVIPEGGSIEVMLSPVNQIMGAVRTATGELVVYRETWESRYIHRKRGTLLSEDEYLLLPDRSLLGSAKTDYRLHKRGFVREPVERIPVNPSRFQKVAIAFESGGYYHIALEFRDQNFRADYGEGIPEVWVVPQSGNLETLRSARPRLVHEKGPDGSEEILVLSNLNNSLVLLNIEFADGTHRLDVVQPEATAVYLQLDESLPSDIEGLGAAIVAGGETVILNQEIEPDLEIQWDLKTERTSGLNPGVPVNWDLERPVDEGSKKLLWAFYPDFAQMMLRDWLGVQAAAFSRKTAESKQGIYSMSRRLPLYDPLQGNEASRNPSAMNFKSPGAPSAGFNALYPELGDFRWPAGFLPEFNLGESTNGTELSLEGLLPNAAGKWLLVAVDPASREAVAWHSWPLSTELPIRSSISGPSLLRLDDQVTVPLLLENTTPREETLQVILDTGSVLSVGERTRDVRVLAPSQKDALGVQLTAVSAGQGSLQSRAEGAFSSTAAVYDCFVQGAESYPEVRAFLVSPGVRDWQAEVDLAGWESARILVSSGLGPPLLELWPFFRERVVRDEPLLAALGSWAVYRVQAHHGILKSRDKFDSEELFDLLDSHSANGGWSWNPGGPADPWLSSLVVWSLETFSEFSAEMPEDILSLARTYLESVLIDESIEDKDRLFALRALAVPALGNPRVRPSRIQAKTFLEFLHKREELDNEALGSLLQIARAYRFNEEVRLLLEALSGRFAPGKSTGAGNFLANSLAYLALSEGQGQINLRERILRQEFQSLNLEQASRSWHMLGGYMNLLAAFFWEGDFNVGGSATLSLEGQEPRVIPLQADALRPGSVALQLEESGLPPDKARIGLDAGSAESAVTVILAGRARAPLTWPSFPEHDVHYLHEYLQSTLLAGSRLKVEEVTDDTVLHEGDTLQVHVSLYLEKAQPFAELSFAVPAGASLSAGSIQYSMEAPESADSAVGSALTISGGSDALERTVRVEPFASGRHEFILSYQLDWAGVYDFPSSQILFPKTGEVYQLGEDWKVVIEACPDSSRLTCAGAD